MSDRRRPLVEVSPEDLHAALASFAANAAVFTDSAASDEAVRQAGTALREIMPTLRAAGLMRIFRVKNAKLRQFLLPRKKRVPPAAVAAERKPAAGGDGA